jgi:hypothetical protein
MTYEDWREVEDPVDYDTYTEFEVANEKAKLESIDAMKILNGDSDPDPM